MRIGTGFDIHRLVAGRPLVLAGVELPFDLGPEGHSDGDALTHAIIDALLGAACLGDIGQWFPPGDPRWANAPSLKMLEAVAAELRKNNLFVGNVDATVILEQPRLAPFTVSIRENLAGVLGISTNRLSVKATTCEKLGPIGRGEAIAAEAVALVTE